jgi:glucosyl-dolichyl phosphate glucuronosyltransferase
VESIAARLPVSVRYIPVPEIGLHNGRHAGAKAAKGEILIFVDDDIIAADGWLKAIVDTFKNREIHLVGGPIEPLFESNPPNWLEAFWETASPEKRWCIYLSLLNFGRKPIEIDPVFIFGANFAIRRETLNKLGGFHPDSLPGDLKRFRGDGETAVTRKAGQLKLKAFYQPDAMVYHHVPQNRLTSAYFEQRAFLQGISNSFTAIRNNSGIEPIKNSGVIFDWKAYLRRLKLEGKKLLKQEDSPTQEQSNKIKTKVRAALRAGFEYHQNEVRNDPALLEWVLKSDYWDGLLPLPHKYQNKILRKRK